MVRLDPMTETEFRAYLEDDIQRFAQAQIRAGNWHPTEALEKSRKEHQRLLPDGLASKHQYLFSICAPVDNARSLCNHPRHRSNAPGGIT